eukprot:203253_1
MCYIFMCKSWMLWFNASLTDAITDIEWLTYISKQNKSNNWFIKNESTYGNPKYILTFTLLALCIFVSLGMIPFPSESLEYKLIFLFASLCPSIVIGIITYKTHCVDDIFKIKQEMTIYCCLGAPSLLSLYIRLFCIQSIHSIPYLVFIFIPSICVFLSVYFQTQYILKLFQLESAHSIQMTPVSPSSKCIASQYSPQTTQTPAPITIKTDPWTPTTTCTPTHVQQQTPSFFNITPLRSTPTGFDSMDLSSHFPDIADMKPSPPLNRIKLIDVIQDPQFFALFIRHITKEFAFENLLYIVETVQFQQRLIKELENEHENDMNEKSNEEDEDEECPSSMRRTHFRTPTVTDEINNVRSKKSAFKFKDLSLPSSVPQSPIVYSDCHNWYQCLSQIVLPKEQSNKINTDDPNSPCTYNPYKQSVLIYNKYLKSSAELAVNISSEQRMRFNQIFEINMKDEDRKENVYLLSKEELVDLWEDSQLQVWNLVGSSFRRFRKTPVFIKILAQR